MSIIITTMKTKTTNNQESLPGKDLIQKAKPDYESLEDLEKEQRYQEYILNNPTKFEW